MWLILQVGNPETNDYYDYKGLLEYAWSHAVISDQLYYKSKQVCDFKVADWSSECITNMNKVFADYGEIDIYNIYAPSCLLNTTSSSAEVSFSWFLYKIPSFFEWIIPHFLLRKVEKMVGLQLNGNGFRRMRVPGGYDPCFSIYAAEYFNRPDVKLALHAATHTKWEVCR